MNSNIITKRREEKRREDKSQTFQYLKALLIIMVIDDHMSSHIGILSSVFPYNSFYMPLFVMISGYFYKKQPIIENLKKKINHLLFPYIVWCLLGNLLAYCLYKFDIVNWYIPLTLNMIKKILIHEPTPMVGAGWFAIMLFYVTVLYNVIRILLKKEGLVIDISILLVSIILGVWILQLCMEGYAKDIVTVSFFRLVFYFQFYHIGWMFKCYWEKGLKKWNGLYVCLGCVFCNVILMCLLKKNINFNSTANMGFFNSRYLPLVTSITGGLFWYEVVSYLTKKNEKIRWIDFIADNTFVIMMSHLIFANIPNFYVYFKIRQGSKLYVDFDMLAFRSGPWFRYTSETCILGFFCGLIGSLIIAYIISVVKSRIDFKPIIR